MKSVIAVLMCGAYIFISGIIVKCVGGSMLDSYAVIIMYFVVKNEVDKW
jgi:hypothetical protein